MESGRELFNLFLRGDPLPRPPFLPLLRGLLARIGGTSVKSLTADPTIWANLLLKTADLFDLDGIVAGFHFSLMAEACGCQMDWQNDRPRILAPLALNDRPEESGRLQNAIEAARRVFQVSRPRRACVIALTGPLTLAWHLFGGLEGLERLDEVKDLLTRVTEVFCRIRPDVIIFMEGRPMTSHQHLLKQRRLYGTLKKITNHYGVSTGLYLQGYQPADLERLTALGLEIYILGPSLNLEGPPAGVLPAILDQALGAGLGLPLADPVAARQAIIEGAELYRARAGRGFFFTSFGPITREVDLESLHALVRLIHQVRL